ncbi:hypothetical protein HYW94_03900, partial [Candidatus Uhrbacteria bacterium]|nr:hypothetical protein [Candidatus Uhrbacteria bacterium]
MTKCSIKNIVIVAVFGVFLFPVSAHADFMGELAGCTGADVISLSGFLYLFVQIAQWILGITGSLALL